MGILENEWIRAGVNGTAGSFGSGGNTSPGLLFDPEGTGTFNTGYDYLTPGSPFDGFSVKIGNEVNVTTTDPDTGEDIVTPTMEYTNYANNNGRSNAIDYDASGLVDGTNTLTWNGNVRGVFDITNSYELAPNTPYIDITSSITMGTDASTLSFGRFIDPDSQGMPGDSSATDNVLGYGIIPDTNVAFSEATVSRYALGIYTTDSNVTAGVEGWTQEADGYEGTNYTDADGNPVNYGNGDDTVGISWNWTDVSAGDIATASYAYIFGPSAFDAAEDAIDGGAGGGDTTTTDGWGTLEDVGSATDAAESGGTSDPDPTVTDSDYDSATYTDGVASGTIGIIGTGTLAVLDDDGLYSTRTSTFGGTLTMSRDSEVPTTWSDDTTTTESVSETFTREVSGTHSDVMTDYDMDWDGATHTDVGEVNAPGFSWTFSDDLSTFSGSASDTGTIARESIVSTDFTYDRTTETTNADDFADASGYTDTTSTETTTSEVTATYDVTVNEEFTRTVTSSATGTEDTSVARVIDWAGASVTDTGSVATPDVTVTASSDYSTRTGTNTSTGTIARQSVAATTVTYDYVNTIVTVDDFAEGSAYEDTTTTVIGDAQTLEVTNALTYNETFDRTVTVGISDVMSNSVAGDSTSVSQGYDSSTYVDTVTLEANEVDNTVTIVLTGERTGEEVYEVTTPTTFTYDRTVTTTTEDDFAAASAYTDTSNTVTATSEVNETYDIVTEAREDRVGGVIVTASTDVNQDKVVLDLQKNLARNTTFGDISFRGYDHEYGVYGGRTNVVRLGGTKTSEDGLSIGAGVHIANSNIDGNTGKIDSESTQFGATVSRNTNGWDISGTVQHTETTASITSTPSVSVEQYGTDLDIGTITMPVIPTLGADADSSNTSVSFLAKGPGEQFRPIIGGTLGKEEVDSISYSVNGVNLFEQSGKDSTYGYATVGGELTLGLATITALHHTDGVNNVSLGIEKVNDNVTLSFSANRTMTNLGDTNSVSAGLVFKF